MNDVETDYLSWSANASRAQWIRNEEIRAKMENEETLVPRIEKQVLSGWT